MSFTWKLDLSTNDLVISNKGKLDIVYGADEVQQRILCTLRHFWKEYFLNVYSGIPWNEVILGSSDTKTAELIIRSAVLDVPGVLSVMTVETELNRTTRQLSIYVSAEVEDYDGQMDAKYINLSFAATPNEFAQDDNLFASVNWNFAEIVN